MHTKPRVMRGVVALAICLLAPTAHALAGPVPAGVQAGRPTLAAARAPLVHKAAAGCGVSVPVIGGLAGGVCEVAGEAVGVVGGLAGEAVGAVGGSILNVLAQWMIGAATSITGFVSKEMTQTTTPQLTSGWYEAQFAPMADLGAALGLLVTLVAFASAAIRRSPQALAGTIAGIARAGIGTGLVVALTVIGLGVADQVSTAVLSGSPHAFWETASHAWGTGGFGGFGSSALATLIALIEVFAAVFVWLELIVRDAAIYLAVLFFPVALAAAIWPALDKWPGRLGRLLMLFVILKPVALIVLCFAGNAAASGLSFSGGVPGSVGTILAATVIFALAAFAPWTLMYLLAADAESSYMASGFRSGAGAAVADENQPSVRNAGGLRDLGGGATGPAVGSQGGGGASGGGGNSGGGGGGGSPFTPGSPSGGGGSSGGALSDPGGLTVPAGGEAVGAGAVGAAAGVGVAGIAVAGASNFQASEGSQSLEGGQQAGGRDGGEGASPGAFSAVPDGPPEQSAGRPVVPGGAPDDAQVARPGSAGALEPSPGESEAPPSGVPAGGQVTQPLARSPRRTPGRHLAVVSGHEPPAKAPGGKAGNGGGAGG